MTRQNTSDHNETALFDWACATALARTIHDTPTLFGLEEIPIRPTPGQDEEAAPAHSSGSTK